MEKTLKNKMKTKGLIRKLGTGALVLTATVGLGLVEKETRTYNQFNQTYQGYTKGGEEGRTFFVFDKESLQDRGSRGPEYFIQGNFNLTKELEIGEKYQVKTMKNGFPIGLFNPKKITSVNPFE